MKQILKGIKIGDSAAVLDVLYFNPKRKSLFSTDKISEDDALIIIYLDKDGNKKIEILDKPKQEIWFTKQDNRHLWKYTRDSKPREMLFPVLVRPRDILKTIYDELKDEDTEYSKYFKEIYNRSYQTNDFRLRKELHKYPHVFMSDFSIEDSYRLNLAYQYDLSKRVGLKKSFMDIETSVEGLTTEEIHKLHYDEITAISLVLDYNPANPEDDTIQVYGLFLRDYKKFPPQKEWEENKKKFLEDCDKMFNNRKLTIGGKELIHNQKYNINIKCFDSEAELIIFYFSLINAANPDTNAVWNIAFDIPKIIARCHYLGIDFTSLASSKRIPKEYHHFNIVIDDRASVKASQRNTSITGSTEYLFIDQMLLYAGMTKGNPAPSNALDFISDLELGIGKVKFDKGVNIKNIARKDYWKFALYSLNDTVLLQLLDHYLGHIDLMFINTQMKACSPLQTVRPTKEIRQYYSIQKMKRWDLIPGNNDNVDYITGMNDELYDFMLQQLDGNEEEKEDDESSDEKDEYVKKIEEITENLEDRVCDAIEKAERKLGGGVVLSPQQNNPNGVEILGIKSKNVFTYGVDMDYVSEYPTVKITRNCGKETEIGRLIIESRVSNEQDMFKNSTYLPGAEYISDYISKDWLSMGRAYFNLPTVKELVKKYGR